VVVHITQERRSTRFQPSHLEILKRTRGAR
jgi:hypothetical protein